MNEAQPVEPSTPPVADAAANAAADTGKPLKAPGVLRKAALGFIVVSGLIGAAAFPFVIEPMVIGQLHQTLAQNNLRLAEGSQLSVSFFGGSLSGHDLVMHEIKGSQNVLQVKKLEADLALLESVQSGDVVMTNLIIDGLSGSFRRENGGRIPILEPADKEGKPTDWLGLGKQLMEWYKKYAPESTEDKTAEEKPGEPKPPEQAPAEPVPPKPKPATDWPDAVVYHPQPQPGQPWPRVVIRNLSINGTNFGLPDESPFDVTAFQLQGKDVSLRLHPHEVMNLDGQVSTKGSGPLTMKIQRNGGKEGTMALKAEKVDLAALSNPAISGDALSSFGATGKMDLSLSTNWLGWKQTSDVVTMLSETRLQPNADASDTTRQIASTMNALDGKPISWKPTLGGTLFSPVFTDYGLQSLQASAVEAGKQKAIEEGTKAVQKEADKLLDKNPAAKGAADKAKDLLKGFGK
jgi:hypothetical protein